MEVYTWQATSKNGEKKNGEMEADNEGLIIGQLRRQGFKDIKVKPKSKRSFRKAKVTEIEVVVFTRQLAVMVGAGLPLVSCFDLVSKGSENPRVREATSNIRTAIESGVTLTEAMSREPDMFDELFINLVQAGEQSGILDAVLNRLAIYKEKAAALKGKVKSAMTYPISVIVIALVITAVLMIYVVPVFAELFESFGAKLPAPTRVVIDISNWTQKYWWVMGLAIFASLRVFAQMYKTNEHFHYKMDKLSLNLPIFGPILRKAAVARFARTFGTMIAAGTPILESLVNVAKTAGNRVVEEAVLNSRSSISEGRTLTEPLIASGIFPSMVTQMIAIGESTGNLETMLNKVADFYEEEVDRAVDSLTSLLEPLILVFLGVLIGGLVVAMYMPIFQMGAAV
ncbi:MAG: type II secretion system F family protein [Magnetococcales bacterium]|nr:type II secretion system F family protein [Magnetococcales bacterium]NGZ26082.1 type II secretion system F family protein [Magnetococcales bacterium]